MFFKKGTKKTLMSVPKKAESELDYLPIDLSFIPEDLMTEELRRYHLKELLPPTNEKGVNSSCSIEDRRCKEAEKNFAGFDYQIRNFALKQYDKKNYELAEKCYSYLIDLYKDGDGEKVHLTKIYRTLFP